MKEATDHTVIQGRMRWTEIKLIKRVWSHNKRCVSAVQDKHGYTRSVSSLLRAMRKLDIGRRK